MLLGGANSGRMRRKNNLFVSNAAFPYKEIDKHGRDRVKERL